MSDTPRPVTPERIMQMAWGYAPPLILEAAIQHRVFDLLDGGPKAVPQLAAETGASERGLRVLLNALVGLAFLAKQGEAYTLTPESAAFLVSTKPGFQGGFFRHISRQVIPGWLDIVEGVRSGRPAAPVNQEGAGSAFFEEFVESLFPMNYRPAQLLGEALGIPGATEPVSVLDIAAGSGVWGIALAQQSPAVRVTAVDWPGVLSVTRRVAERSALADRFTFVGGDIQEADLGSGHYAATLGHILHSEGEERSRRLLKRVHAALAPGGTVAIGEFMTNDDRTGPPMSLIFAVNMLLHTEHGDTFSFAELSGWLTEAGFENPRLLEVPAPSPLVLATRST
jgi:ubiquinone/menaquinone biosynthesis C-methylase UbiE